MEDASDSRTQFFAGHCTNIVIVLCAKVINEKGIDPRSSIPFRQRFQVFFYGVIRAVIHALCHRDIVVTLAERPIVLIHIPDQLRIVLISPEFLSFVVPGYVPLNLHAVRQLVENNILHIRVVGHNQAEVVKAVHNVSSLVADQLVLPVLILLFGKRCRCCILLFLQKQP